MSSPPPTAASAGRSGPGWSCGGGSRAAPRGGPQRCAASSPSAATTTAGVQSSSTISSSRATATGPNGTHTAPARTAPSTETQNAAPLPSRTSTRSPGRAPASRRRAASALTAASNSAQVSVVPPVTSTIAAWSGVARAARATRSARWCGVPSCGLPLWLSTVLPRVFRRAGWPRPRVWHEPGGAAAPTLGAPVFRDDTRER